MDAGVAEWLDGLPPELTRQAALLRRLLESVRADQRWRVLELQCSVARGTGDADSDLDLGLGVADGAWPAALDDLDRLLVGRLGPVVDAPRLVVGGARPAARGARAPAAPARGRPGRRLSGLRPDQPARRPHRPPA